LYVIEGIGKIRREKKKLAILMYQFQGGVSEQDQELTVA